MAGPPISAAEAKTDSASSTEPIVSGSLLGGGGRRSKSSGALPSSSVYGDAPLSNLGHHASIRAAMVSPSSKVSLAHPVSRYLKITFLEKEFTEKIPYSVPIAYEEFQRLT